MRHPLASLEGGGRWCSVCCLPPRLLLLGIQPESGCIAHHGREESGGQAWVVLTYIHEVHFLLRGFWNLKWFPSQLEKKKKKKTQKNTTHAYRKVISKGETTDFLNKSHKKDSCSLYEALTTCDFAIFNLIIIHHFLKGAQLGSVWVCRVGVCVCKSVCV